MPGLDVLREVFVYPATVAEVDQLKFDWITIIGGGWRKGCLGTAIMHMEINYNVTVAEIRTSGREYLLIQTISSRQDYLLIQTISGFIIHHLMHPCKCGHALVSQTLMLSGRPSCMYTTSPRSKVGPRRRASEAATDEWCAVVFTKMGMRAHTVKLCFVGH